MLENNKREIKLRHLSRGAKKRGHVGADCHCSHRPSSNWEPTLNWLSYSLQVVGRPQPPGQTKESARRDGGARLLCGHMFLLCGAGPYVCIGWLWAWGSAICFYYAA